MAKGVNGKKLLGGDRYSKYLDEFRSDTTIGGEYLSKDQKKEGAQAAKSGKIDFEKFVTKVLAQGGDEMGKDGEDSPKMLDKSRLLPGTEFQDLKKPEEDDPEVINEKQDDKISEILDFLNNFLDPSLTRIEESLGKILGNIEGQIEAREDLDDKAQVSAAKAGQEATEAGLEATKDKGNPIQGALDKAVKPVGNLIGDILRFFTNVVLGGVILSLVKILENPWRLLDPIKNIINGVITIFNGVTGFLWDLFRKPLNAFYSFLNDGFAFIIDGINKAINLLPFVNIEIPKVSIPEIPEYTNIPTIPLADDPKAPSAPSGGGAVAMAGGGLVPMSGGGVVSDLRQGVAMADGGVVGDQQGQIDPLTLLSLNTGLPGAQGVQGNQGAQGVQGNQGAQGDGPAMFPGGLGGGGGGLDALTEQAKVYTKKDQGFFGRVRGGLDMLTGNRWDLDRQDVVKNTLADANRTGLENYASDSGGGENIPGTGLQRMSGGGLAQHFNSGGKVPGKGEGDTVPAMLTPGEFVMSKGAVQKVGVENLMKINAAGGGTNQPTLMQIKGFAGGGMVSPPGPPSGSVNTIIPPSSPPGSTSGGGGAPKNATPPVVHAVDEGNSALLIVKSIYNIVG